jgi:hypothetical protein
MSRTTLCVLTAAVLATLSLGVGLVRYQVMGSEGKRLGGPSTYKVTMVIRGKSSGEAKVISACPLDFNRQHVCREDYRSAELLPKPVEQHNRERRQIQWLQRPGTGKGSLQARYEFICNVDTHHPTSPMSKLSRVLNAAPRPGESTRSEPRIDPSDPDISEQALHLTAGLESPADKVRALFRYVDEEIANEPSAGGPSQRAVDCLKSGAGDAAAKSRLLTALCRNRGIPARLVTGLTLRKLNEQSAHTWVEAWIGDHWMPMCPFHHYCGRVPPSYLIFGYGDMAMVRGHNVHNLEYACLVEHQAPVELNTNPSLLDHLFARLSLFTLPPTEHGLVEFLLLLPIAALIICIYRNLIGINSFGTFAPALVGLAFRQIESLPGILVFVSIILIGWGMRRILDRYHLLQVPRTAFMLSLVVIVLISAVVAANFQDLAATRYFSLFPMVILTGMIERFWTLETEDGTTASFKTLVGTMLIAATISLVLSLHAVVHHMFAYPETLGGIMAVQLLIGRYTGYRLSELFRFRDFIQPPPPAPGPRLLETS